MSADQTFEPINVRIESSRELSHASYRDDPHAVRFPPARDQMNYHCQTEDRPKAGRKAKDQDYKDQRPIGSKAFCPQSFPLSDYAMVDMRDPDDVFYNWPFDDGFGSDDEQYVHTRSPFLKSVDDVLVSKTLNSSSGGKKKAPSPRGQSQIHLPSEIQYNSFSTVVKRSRYSGIVRPTSCTMSMISPFTTTTW